ncbi:MAG: 4Fe-4S binding protein [Sphingobacteriales bacterium]|nr:4Fe-4S binding protein [Sphingobacteriales bacterium]
MKQKLKDFQYPIIGFAAVIVILSIVQIKVERPMLLAERFFNGGGWLTILLLGSYAAFLIKRMKNPSESAKWRKRSWLLFSFVFFGQLAMGLSGFEKFLMTGKLHFPIPALIVGGPLYRMQLSFMPVLFISTIVLSGPAWCSQLCYFGAFDLWASSGKKPVRRAIKHLWALKFTFLLLVILMALILRLSGASNLTASVFSAIFGILGIAVILLISPKKGKMLHCVAYCPVGTLVRFMKLINPFRMYIATNCNDCMACSLTCRYDALNVENIRQRKPGPTCTYCGDCISSCKTMSIRYRLFSLKPETARMTWIVITVALHAVFMGLARI